ncbi:MAG: hypothetical protein MUC96_21445 [Myxococcaceae bacterium]|jgi:hypothetical protein|nr:hypothetical protein [Myxococcaceae bacterium]
MNQTLAALNQLEGQLNVFTAASRTRANFDKQIAAAGGAAVVGALAGILGGAVREGMGDRDGGGNFGLASGAASVGANISQSAAYRQAKDREVAAQMGVNDALANAVNVLSGTDPSLGLKLSDAMTQQDAAGFERLRTQLLPELRTELAHYPVTN